MSQVAAEKREEKSKNFFFVFSFGGTRGGCSEVWGTLPYPFRAKKKKVINFSEMFVFFSDFFRHLGSESDRLAIDRDAFQIQRLPLGPGRPGEWRFHLKSASRWNFGGESAKKFGQAACVCANKS